MDLLKVLSVTKRIAGLPVLTDVTFTQQKSRKIAIAGETGSGKSSLLRIIAGLVQPDTGEILFENKRVKGPAEKLIPGHEGIAYLSQQFELANNYRVEEVLAYANQLEEKEAETLYEICRINHLLKRRTDQVSGGEKQRIAVARLLISSPRLLLLDEPYSNLDMIHKNILRSVIYDIGKRLDITCILVSHDPVDTLSWAEEIIVMKQGCVVQKGTPEQIYRQPVNEYTAALFGKYNLLSNVASEPFNMLPGTGTNGKSLFIRPEDFKLVEEESLLTAGTVSAVSFMGSSYEVEVQLPGCMIIVRTGINSLVKGDTVYVSVASDKAWFI